MSAGYIRIGELSRRTGVSPELLRAWERRYGLFEPDRSPGRFRLYSDADVSRVEAMRSQIAHGLSAAEAARLVLASSSGRRAEPGVALTALEEPTHALREALAGFDETGAHAALDQLIASLSLESFLRSVVLPLLHEIGEGWERGEITVAQEHFASNVIRGRLMALGRGWGRGAGRHALLAAPAGERHDLGLVVLALMLRDHGWRVTFLGADTPISTITDTSRRLAPEVVALAMLTPIELEPAAVHELARGSRVVLAGAGATAAQARRLGVEYFEGGPTEAVDFLAGLAVTAR
jgi:DNA-binding transcriptional MerR regulator